MTLAIFAIVFALFLLWTWRSNELFHLSVRSGKVLLIRGRIPAGLLADFRTVLKRSERASVRVQKTSSGGRLTTTGLTDGTTQQLRNMFGLCPQAQLRSAKPIANPSLGQLLGIASLAWWLDRGR
jgi:Protein of unknown function (DUF3634)